MTQLSEAYRKYRKHIPLRLAISRFPSLAQCAGERAARGTRRGCSTAPPSCEEVPRVVCDTNFHRFYHAIHDYCVVDLSAFYFDVLRIACNEAPRNKSRRSAQTAVWKISSALVRLAAPILVLPLKKFEVFAEVPGETESVHMTLFPGASRVLAESPRTRRRSGTACAGALCRACRPRHRAAKIIGGGLEAESPSTRRAEAPGLQKCSKKTGRSPRALHRFQVVILHPSSLTSVPAKHCQV